MITFRTPLVAAAAGAALLLGACATPTALKTAATTPAATPAATTTDAATAAATTPAAPAATSQSAVTSVDLAGSRSAQPTPAVASKAQPYVYFDFDSAVVRSEFSESIDAHARQLLAAPDKRLRIEGHTDERGSREYNLALGQRRADAVAQSLNLLGVPDSRLEVVSYGAERPKAEGSDDDAWAKNRRAALRSERADRVAQSVAPR